MRNIIFAGILLLTSINTIASELPVILCDITMEQFKSGEEVFSQTVELLTPSDLNGTLCSPEVGRAPGILDSSEVCRDTSTVSSHGIEFELTLRKNPPVVFESAPLVMASGIEIPQYQISIGVRKDNKAKRELSYTEGFFFPFQKSQSALVSQELNVTMIGFRKYHIDIQCFYSPQDSNNYQEEIGDLAGNRVSGQMQDESLVAEDGEADESEKDQTNLE
ncbi:MAG: hypothetical protein HOE90_02710 [Bacteriovoracaceae bacterium]|jgi:hypothetical protein|nr:hypothetical protein [Bacteriovoracaceae bacterium]